MPTQAKPINKQPIAASPTRPWPADRVPSSAASAHPPRDRHPSCSRGSGHSDPRYDGEEDARIISRLVP